MIYMNCSVFNSLQKSLQNNVRSQFNKILSLCKFLLHCLQLNSAGAGFSLTGQPAAATKPVGISLGTTQATSTAGPTLGTLGTAASTTITGNPLGTASSGGGITFGTQKTTAAPTLGSLIGGATTAASTTQSTLGFPTAVAATRYLLST